MRCNDFTERDLIKRLSEILGGLQHDDCVLIDLDSRYLAITTDMLHESSDFPPSMTPWQMGWMAAAVNLSDIASMGAVPLGLMLALGIPSRSDLTLFDCIFSGLRDCAKAYDTRILGGDLDCHEELTITGTALGTVEKDLVLRRRGAKVGDILCTTGRLGGAGAGLKLLNVGGVDTNPYHKPLISRLLEPKARLNEGRKLALTGYVTSMMDNSDGLALSLYDLADESKVGFVVNEDLLPIEDGVETVLGTGKLDSAMYFGGDFELLFTVDPKGIDRVLEEVEATVIGKVIENGLWMEYKGHRSPIPPRGYQHMGSDATTTNNL